MTYFLDTSAILNGALNSYPKCYISPITLIELEHIKNSKDKSDDVKYQARKAIRDIIESFTIQVTRFSQFQLKHIIHKYSFLMDINDHYILSAAELLGRKEQVFFVTSDGAQLLFSQHLPHLMPLFYIDKAMEPEKEYCGWEKFYPTDNQLNTLYSDTSNNIFNCIDNQFVEIYHENELKDILFWNGEKYRTLKYGNLKNKFLNETIQPRNLEQKLAFDLLQNNDIPVKLLIGPPGTGKDFLMLLHALDLVQRGEKDKIIFIRNLVPFKDAPEIGFLAGSLQEKIEWGLGPIASILGEEGLAMMQESGQIEAVNLGFIRGCSWDNSILYVSEGQNITGGGYKLLVSRCGNNSELWINGDILQTDNKKFEINNGISRIISSLKGNKLFGMVKLLRTERSAVADLASKI